MFVYIEGKLVAKDVSEAVLDVHGIGYQLIVSISTFERLPELGSTVKLLTQFIVREDAQTLYGFIHEDERYLFQQVLKVSGFGAKLAMSILSSMSPSEFAQLIESSDKAALIRLPGVGAKSADRLIVELKDKLHAVNSVQSGSLPATSHDAESALIGLGYKSAEVRRVLSQVDASKDIGSMIRQALQLLSRK